MGASLSFLSVNLALRDRRGDMETKSLQTLADLTPDDVNANKGTQRGGGFLEDSLGRYGAGRSILVDANGVIIAGNKTAETAAALGMDDLLVVESDGTRLVVVQRVDLDMLHDVAARELGIADNRVGQMNLDWDAAALAELGRMGVDFNQWFSEAEIAKLLSDLPPLDVPAALEGETPAEKDKPQAQDMQDMPGKGGPDMSLASLCDMLLMCPCCGEVLRIGEDGRLRVEEDPFGEEEAGGQAS